MCNDNVYTILLYHQHVASRMALNLRIPSGVGRVVIVYYTKCGRREVSYCVVMIIVTTTDNNALH